MLPTKNFTGSVVVSTLLKIFAILIGVGGLAFVVVLAAAPKVAGVDANTEVGFKIGAILATFVSTGILAALIAAAAYGLDLARDTNARVSASVQIAASSLQMSQSMQAPPASYAPPAATFAASTHAAPTPSPSSPAQGATYNPGFGQPQATQPGQYRQ